MIPGAINLPAQSFFLIKETFAILVKTSQITKVVFHCQSCKQPSRGTRCANWFQETLEAMEMSHVQSYYLEGGIKEWVVKHPELCIDIPA